MRLDAKRLTNALMFKLDETLWFLGSGLTPRILREL
jgi:hypothetical protein